MDFQQEIIKAIQTANISLAAELMHQYGNLNGYEHFTENILIPILEKYTIDDSKMDASPLALGYVAARFAETAMNLIIQNAPANQIIAPTKGPVVIGNIEDDFHSLGRRIICTFLKTNGWIVHDLGNDIPAPEFVEKAIDTQSPIIAVSAMMYSTAVNIKQVREEIIKRNLEHKVKLAVGGAIFTLRADLLHEVGGDGTAKNALRVPKLFDDLLLSLKN